MSSVTVVYGTKSLCVSDVNFQFWGYVGNLSRVFNIVDTPCRNLFLFSSTLFLGSSEVVIWSTSKFYKECGKGSRTQVNYTNEENFRKRFVTLNFWVCIFRFVERSI